MPPTPSIGMYLPGNGFVNAQNSSYADGTGDPVTGLSAYQGGGLYPGRTIQLSDAEAAVADVNAATAITLFGGTYQWVQMDSGATSLAQGQCLFWKQSSLALPYVVTNAATGNEPLIAGVLVNPAAYLPTAGNYFLMFVAASGRVQVIMKSSFTGTAAARDPIIQTAGANTFDDVAGVTSPTFAQIERFVGVSEVIPVVSALSTIQWSNKYFVRA